MDRLSFKLAVPLMAILAVAAPVRTSCQTVEPDQPPAVGPAPSAPSNSPPSSPASNPKTTIDRPVSWRLLPSNLLDDQKRIWTFPARLGERRNWIPTAAILGTTAALVALDPVEGRFFSGTSSFHGFNKAFSGNNVVIGTVAVPASLYIAGLARKDSKMKGTALLSGEAVADAEVLSILLKVSTRRASPLDIPRHGNYSDSWFESGSPLRSKGGFPSGHALAAFSVATVVARRYGNHRWVPYAAYGMATLVAFSRLTLSAHFTSDVFMGAALGYTVSRFAVLQQ